MRAKGIASRRFWRRMSTRSTFHFLLTVFLIFAPVGFISDIWQGGSLSIILVWLHVFYSGTVAIGYAYSFTRSFKVLPFTIVFQFGYQFISWWKYFPGGPETAAEIQSRLVFDGAGIMVCIILAYIMLSPLSYYYLVMMLAIQLTVN